MAEKAADDAALDLFAVDGKNVRSEQIHDDVVVVAGVERDVAAGFGDGADDVKSLVAIEGSDFDGGDVFDFGELAPEFIRENAAADGRLEIDSDDANEWSGAAAVGAVHFFRSERQNGVEEADLRIANGELRGVNADGEAAGASSDVVARERTLAAL